MVRRGHNCRTGKLSGYDGVRWRMKECFDDQPEELGKIISPDTCRNVVHGSDSPENGEREISKCSMTVNPLFASHVSPDRPTHFAW